MKAKLNHTKDHLVYEVIIDDQNLGNMRQASNLCSLLLEN